MSLWFEDWFASELYFLTYGHRNDDDAKLLFDLILKTTGVMPPARVLDLPCGTGRHSVLFAKQGFTVTAADLSPLMIQKAREKAIASGVEIEFHQSDIREFSSAIKFDLTLNLFTSFGYFDDDEENFGIIRSMAEMTQSCGWFVLDYINPVYVRNHLQPETASVNGEFEIVQKRCIEGQRIKKYIEARRGGETEFFTESVALYSSQEITTCLQEDEFSVAAVFGDYHGSPFTSELSPRQIFFAKRN